MREKIHYLGIPTRHFDVVFAGMGLNDLERNIVIYFSNIMMSEKINCEIMAGGEIFELSVCFV